MIITEVALNNNCLALNNNCLAVKYMKLQSFWNRMLKVATGMEHFNEKTGWGRRHLEKNTVQEENNMVACLVQKD